MCTAWEKCMQQDPMTVAYRAKFSAQTFGEGLNGFFERLEWKTIVRFRRICAIVLNT
jgi:hypothetical protein